MSPDDKACIALLVRFDALEAKIDAVLNRATPAAPEPVVSAEDAADAIAASIPWKNGHRPRFWRDAEVRRFLVSKHRLMTAKQARAECVARFGEARTPSTTPIHNLWRMIDKAKRGAK